MLLLKPWYSSFNPTTESFDKIPMWVRLPYLPLQFWFKSCFEAIVDSFRKFLVVDEGSLGFQHTTFSRILVEMDVTKKLPVDLFLKFREGNWLQSMDYEGIPFRCVVASRWATLLKNYELRKITKGRYVVGRCFCYPLYGGKGQPM